MARPRGPNYKPRAPRVEGAASRPILGIAVEKGEFEVTADEFDRCIAYLREAMPGEWEQCKTWPTESGITHISACLRARK